MDMYRRGEYTIFLMGWGDITVAFALLREVPGIHHIVHVEYLGVATTHRSLGIGASFIQKMIPIFLDTYDLMTLQCIDKLIPLYRKNGFELMSKNSHWKGGRYNLMYTASGGGRLSPIIGEKLSLEITETLNRDVWSRFESA